MRQPGKTIEKIMKYNSHVYIISETRNMYYLIPTVTLNIDSRMQHK